MNTLDISAPEHIVRDVILNPDILLRLNPSWFIEQITPEGKGSYEVTLYDDKTEDTSRVQVTVEDLEQSIRYTMNAVAMEFFIHHAGKGKTGLAVHGSLSRESDFPYWMRGLRNYIRLEAGQGRIAKWFLDRCWLRMTPSQRRITVIIIIAEGISIAALIAVVIALKLMR
jgi:hypothetical protein